MSLQKKMFIVMIIIISITIIIIITIINFFIPIFRVLRFDFD